MLRVVVTFDLIHMICDHADMTFATTHSLEMTNFLTEIEFAFRCRTVIFAVHVLTVIITTQVVLFLRYIVIFLATFSFVDILMPDRVDICRFRLA